MNILRAYVLTCCIGIPLSNVQWATEPTPTEATEQEYPFRCDCYAVEPDYDCVMWANTHCENMPYEY